MEDDIQQDLSQLITEITIVSSFDDIKECDQFFKEYGYFLDNPKFLVFSHWEKHIINNNE